MINKTCRIILVSFVLLLCFHQRAFSNETDSLRRLLATTIPDTTRVNVLNALSKSLFNSNPDTSVTIAAKSKLLAEKINYKKGLALAFKNMGIGYYLQGKYKEAVLTWQQALDVYRLLGDKSGIANMLSNQGSVYFNEGDDAKCLDLHLQSLKISEQINDTLRILTSLNNIGVIYLEYTPAHSTIIKPFDVSALFNPFKPNLFKGLKTSIAAK